MVQKLGRTKKAIKVGKISGKDNISRVEEKRVSFIGNNTKRSLEMTLRKIGLDVSHLKAYKMRIKKRI